MPKKQHLYGLRPITLREIPFETRMRAARDAARHRCADDAETAAVLADDAETAAVLAAALAPSDKTYWVSRQAAEELLAAA